MMLMATRLILFLLTFIVLTMLAMVIGRYFIAKDNIYMLYMLYELYECYISLQTTD